MKGLTLPSAAWKPIQSLRPPDSSLSETLGELSSPFFCPTNQVGAPFIRKSDDVRQLFRLDPLLKQDYFCRQGRAL